MPALAGSPRRRHALAVLETAASALFFGVMAYLAKRATRRVAGAQVALVRCAVGLLVALLQSVVRRVPLRPVRKDLIFLRGLFGGSALLLYFLAIGALPVGTATLLQYSSPIFTTAFAALLLRERPSLLQLAALAAAAVGVFLVIGGQGTVLGGAYRWQAIALASAVLSGAAVTAIRAARRHDGPWEVFAGFSLVGLLVIAPLAVARWRSPDARTWLLLLAVGGLAVVAQVLMTHALGVVRATTSGTIGQLTVVTTLTLGHFVDGEPLSAVAAAGAALTIAGTSLASREPRPAPS